MAGLGTAINTAGVMKIENGALVSGQAMMVVLCIALGALVGEMINIEEWFERFGEWLKRKTGNAKDKNFVNGFDLFSWERMRVFRNSCFRVRRCDHVAGNTTETDHDGSRAELSFYDRFYFDLLCGVGINLVWGKKMRVANRLPSLGFAVIAAFLPISY